MSTIVTAISGFDASSSQRLAVACIPGTDDEKLALQGTSTSTHTLGILVNAPGDDEIAHVCTQGICEGVAGGDLRPFEKVAVTSGGKLIAAQTQNDVIVGFYLPAVAGTTATGYDAASDDIINVYLYDCKTTLVP